VNDFLYDTPNVTISFCEIERAETGWGFVVMGMGTELEKGIN
jgi:hypothetical protein